MNRCSVCHELLPGLTQGKCSECRAWKERLIQLPSSDWHQTALQNRQQLHQQRLSQLSSFPLGQSSPPASGSASSAEPDGLNG